MVSTETNLYVLDAQTLAVLATHSIGGLTPRTGFSHTSPTVAGNHIFISRDNGHALTLNLSDAQATPGFSEQSENAAAVVAYGRPAVARWLALFTSDRGLFAYRTDDQVVPTAELTAPEDGSTAIGEVALSALSGDERGTDSVVFRVDGSRSPRSPTRPRATSSPRRRHLLGKPGDDDAERRRARHRRGRHR